MSKKTILKVLGENNKPVSRHVKKSNNSFRHYCKIEEFFDVSLIIFFFHLHRGKLKMFSSKVKTLLNYRKFQLLFKKMKKMRWQIVEKNIFVVDDDSPTDNFQFFFYSSRIFLLYHIWKWIRKIWLVEIESHTKKLNTEVFIRVFAFKCVQITQ